MCRICFLYVPPSSVHITCMYIKTYIVLYAAVISVMLPLGARTGGIHPFGRDKVWRETYVLCVKVGIVEVLPADKTKSIRDFIRLNIVVSFTWPGRAEPCRADPFVISLVKLHSTRSASRALSVTVTHHSCGAKNSI